MFQKHVDVAQLIVLEHIGLEICFKNDSLELFYYRKKFVQHNTEYTDMQYNS